MRRLSLFTIAVVVVARPLNAQIVGLRPGEHGTELDLRHHQGVPPRDAARAARQAQTDGAAAQRLCRPATIRRARTRRAGARTEAISSTPTASTTR